MKGAVLREGGGYEVEGESLRKQRSRIAVCGVTKEESWREDFFLAKVSSL